MRITTENALLEFKKISQHIENLSEKLGYDSDNIDFVRSDVDEYQLYYEMHEMQQALEDIKRKIDYIQSPVVVSGRLYKNTQGRYTIDGNSYFTSGCTIEVLHESEDDPYWEISRVEFKGDDYYIVGLSDIPMEGLYCRVRK